MIDTLRIGAYDFTVERMSPAQVRAANGHGSFSSAELKIRVDENPISGASAVDTLLHEINHAIYFAYLLEDEDKEERTVATLATAWTQIYRDNPALLVWIENTLRPGDEVLRLVRENEPRYYHDDKHRTPVSDDEVALGWGRRLPGAA